MKESNDRTFVWMQAISSDIDEVKRIDGTPVRRTSFMYILVSFSGEDDPILPLWRGHTVTL